MNGCVASTESVYVTARSSTYWRGSGNDAAAELLRQGLRRLVVMACGIVGLTSYWVSQRRRQIGIRRALGATRPGIVRSFQTENLLIVAAGSIVGVAMGFAANLWMMSSGALARLPIVYPVAGVIAMFALGQLAVLWPALRAAAVPPAEATRTV